MSVLAFSARIAVVETFVENESPLGVPTHCFRFSISICPGRSYGDRAVSEQTFSDIKQESYKNWSYDRI